MQANPRFTLIAIAAVLLASPTASQAAGSLSLIPDSAEALGIVGGRFANLSDATTARVAPANMIYTTSPTLQINTGFTHNDLKFTSNAGERLDHQEPWGYPFSLYALMPIIPNKLVFGIGISTPYGFETSYDQSSSLRYYAPSQFRLRTWSITPSAAWRVHDKVTIGLGLDIMQGDFIMHQIIPLGGTDGQLHLDAEGWGIGGFGSILWELTPRQRISLIGQLPLRLDMSGNFEAKGVPSGLGAGLANRSEFGTEMTLPASLAIGYGIDLTDRLTLGFDFKWTANHSHDDIPLDTSDSNSLLPQSSLPLNWRNSIDLGTGATYKLSDQWLLRAGYLFSENSMPDRTYTPAIPAYDRHIFSVGVGWKGERDRIDLTYGFIYHPSRTVNDANIPDFNGRYKNQSHTLMLSLSRKF
jgi:long-chain fatty acid transport protein